MRDKQPTVPLWVCTDCMMLHANGDISEDADREPLGLLANDELTAGMLWEYHAEDCPNRLAEAMVDECYCETDEFSWRPCPGCGSTLGGTRHAITAWIDETEESQS